MYSSSWPRVSGKWSRRNRRPRTLLPGSKWYVVTVGPEHSAVSACSFGARFRIAWCARNAVLRCGSKPLQVVEVTELRKPAKPTTHGTEPSPRAWNRTASEMSRDSLRRWLWPCDLWNSMGNRGPTRLRVKNTQRPVLKITQETITGGSVPEPIR